MEHPIGRARQRLGNRICRSAAGPVVCPVEWIRTVRAGANRFCWLPLAVGGARPVGRRRNDCEDASSTPIRYPRSKSQQSRTDPGWAYPTFLGKLIQDPVHCQERSGKDRKGGSWKLYAIL